MSFVFVLILAAKTLVTLSAKTRRRKLFSLKQTLPHQGQALHLRWENLV
jgi:cell division protein FtsL